MRIKEDHLVHGTNVHAQVQKLRVHGPQTSGGGRGSGSAETANLESSRPPGGGPMAVMTAAGVPRTSQYTQLLGGPGQPFDESSRAAHLRNPSAIASGERVNIIELLQAKQALPLVPEMTIVCGHHDQPAHEACSKAVCMQSGCCFAPHSRAEVSLITSALI